MTETTPETPETPVDATPTPTLEPAPPPATPPGAPRPAPSAYRRVAPYPQEAGLPQKSPILAAFLSAMPGLGNIYNGLYTRGITLFVIWGSLFGMAVHTENSGREENLGFLLPTMMFFWFFNVFDAHRQATLLNLGLTEEDRPWGRGVGGSLSLGIAVLVIGIYGIMVRYFNVDMTWVLDNWPLFVTAFGAWLVARAWKQREAEAPADDLGL